MRWAVGWQGHGEGLRELGGNGDCGLGEMLNAEMLTGGDARGAVVPSSLVSWLATSIVLMERKGEKVLCFQKCCSETWKQISAHGARS